MLLTTVQVGDAVTAIVNGKRKQYQIVTSGKGDIANKKISIDAPLAKVFLSLSEGGWSTPTIRGRVVEVKIEKILKSGR